MVVGRVGLVLASVAVFGAGPGAAPAEDEKTLVSKITEVTVYADRARVTRVASVDVAAAGGQVAFRALPGWIDEGSVRLALSPPDAAQILDVEVRRTFLPLPDELEVRKLASRVYKLSELVAAANLAASKGEAKRLIEQGGVKINGEKATLSSAEIEIKAGESVLLQVGKLKYLKIMGVSE